MGVTNRSIKLREAHVPFSEIPWSRHTPEQRKAYNAAKARHSRHKIVKPERKAPGVDPCLLNQAMARWR